MKKIFLFVLVLDIMKMGLAQNPVIIEKNGTVSSNLTGVDVDFPRTATDITIPETGTYMILISAQGSGDAQPGKPTECYHIESVVKAWSRTRNFELARAPFNYTFGDNGGANPGLKHLNFPYFIISIQQLSKNEIIGLKARVMKQCSTNYQLGSWSVFDARIKIIKL
jgi:hypothetical protein